MFRILCPAGLIGWGLAVAGSVAGLMSLSAQADGFAGWEGLRVIEQEGYPSRMRSADLDGDGDDELVVVNFRNARLDLYGWKDTPDDASPADERGHVNELPLAEEIELTEVPVRQPPIDVAVWREAEGVRASLLVLVADPNRLLEFGVGEAGRWAVTRQWDLLSGRPTGGERVMHLLPDAERGGAQVIISTGDGIQTLRLEPASSDARPASARWLEPRESIGRNDWWLADLDGDGQTDLVEWTTNAAQSLRWYAGSDAGFPGFQPAQTLHDRSLAMATLLERPDAADELLVLESSPEGVVRRYRLGHGESSPLGRQEPLSLPGGENAVWTTLTIDGQTHLIVADPNQPRVTLYAHGPAGWTPGESYPVSGKIQAMQELPAQPGSLVLWPESGGDLHGSYWDGGRLTFPQPLDLSPDADDTLLLGLGRGIHNVWCVQKSDDDLLLHNIKDLPTGTGVGGGSGPYSFGKYTIRFADTAGKAERAIKLDNQRLLIADKFAKGLRRVTLVDPMSDSGEATSETPRRLSKANLDEFRLFRTWNDRDGEVATVGWLTDGVVQWLDADLNAIDQVMLPDGRRIADLVLNDDGSAWALQQGGGAIHRLVPDEAGVLRVDSTVRLDGSGRSLHHDAALGLLLRTGDGVTRLAEGKPREFEVIQSLDARVGRPEGVRDAAVHRVMNLDLDGDGRDDALLADDVRHQLTALVFDEEGQLVPLLSWPVFEDLAYPYGGGGNDQVREPRSVVSLDLDGDGQQDLALLSHDRLLLYLGKEPPSTQATEATP